MHCPHPARVQLHIPPLNWLDWLKPLWTFSTNEFQSNVRHPRKTDEYYIGHGTAAAP